MQVCFQRAATLLPSALLYNHSRQPRKLRATSIEAANTAACCMHGRSYGFRSSRPSCKQGLLPATYCRVNVNTANTQSL